MHQIRIEAPHFVAAVDVRDGRVIHTAPILAYMRGWTETRVMVYAAKQRWRWEYT